MIETFITCNTDLLSFALACTDFAAAILSEKSIVWRNRFLNNYDHPIIESPKEFRIAYQLREMVLQRFPSFALGDGAQGQAALEVLRDMALGKWAARAFLHLQERLRTFLQHLSG
jgi:hypothetical protein